MYNDDQLQHVIMDTQHLIPPPFRNSDGSIIEQGRRPPGEKISTRGLDLPHQNLDVLSVLTAMLYNL
jgi:hypothetical protein